MAPEQDVEGAKVDARADLYAVGKLAFELLTGRKPRTVRPASRLRDDVDARWDDWIFRLVEDDPNDRFASAAESLAALRTLPYPSPRRRRTQGAAPAEGAARVGAGSGEDEPDVFDGVFGDAGSGHWVDDSLSDWTSEGFRTSTVSTLDDRPVEPVSRRSLSGLGTSEDPHPRGASARLAIRSRLRAMLPYAGVLALGAGMFVGIPLIGSLSAPGSPIAPELASTLAALGVAAALAGIGVVALARRIGRP